MPSKSKAQQTLFRMALAVRKGKLPRSKAFPAVLKIVDSDITDKQIQDFAEKIEENNYTSLRNFLNENLTLDKEYYIDHLPSQDDNGTPYKYFVDDKEVEYLRGPRPIKVGNEVFIRGNSKDIPCIVTDIVDKKVYLKLMNIIDY